MNTKRGVWLIGLAAGLTVSVPRAVLPAPPEPPALVLWITVDGLRGDMPLALAPRFGPGGLRWFLDEGLCYANAHFAHSATFTAAGHATLFTGAAPSQHGIVGNDWYDLATKQDVYCVGDPQSPPIGETAPAKGGRSPRNLLSTTIGDELILGSAGRGKVFSVSVKDRGAILPGGHLGKAFWYDTKTGAFATSTYYYQQCPDWVAEWNRAGHAAGYAGRSWGLLGPESSYVQPDSAERAEKGHKHLGTAFPLPLGTTDTPGFYGALVYTPFSDELTVEFAKKLVEQERLGQDAATDLLAISLSATDYIHHAYGPESREAEDNLLRVDRAIADLRAFVEEAVGSGRTLYILSADHGFDDIPEYRLSLRLHAGRHRPEELVEWGNKALAARFGAGRNLVLLFWNPTLYLDEQAVAGAGLDLAAVEQALADAMMRHPGVAFAAARSALLAGRIPDHPLLGKMQRSFHPKRSGHVMIAQEQLWYLYFDADAFAAMHGSPYPYDTHVPLMLGGPGVPARCVYRAVGPEDLAPTLAALLRIRSPSGSSGALLTELLDAGARR